MFEKTSIIDFNVKIYNRDFSDVQYLLICENRLSIGDLYPKDLKKIDNYFWVFY